MEEETEAPDSWRDKAACLGQSDVFFLAMGESKGYEAKRICYTCHVREACLDYACETGVKLGVWGGLNRNELTKERRARARGSASVIQ